MSWTASSTGRRRRVDGIDMMPRTAQPSEMPRDAYVGIDVAVAKRQAAAHLRVRPARRGAGPSAAGTAGAAEAAGDVRQRRPASRPSRGSGSPSRLIEYLRAIERLRRVHIETDCDRRSQCASLIRHGRCAVRRRHFGAKGIFFIKTPPRRRSTGYPTESAHTTRVRKTSAPGACRTPTRLWMMFGFDLLHGTGPGGLAVHRGVPASHRARLGIHDGTSPRQGLRRAIEGGCSITGWPRLARLARPQSALSVSAASRSRRCLPFGVGREPPRVRPGAARRPPDDVIWRPRLPGLTA